MSHLTNVQTEIVNLIILKQTLADLGYTFIEASEGQTVTIKGWNNETTEAMIEVKTGGPYSIGIIHNNITNSYEFTADWWGVENYTSEKQDEIINKITQKYAYNSVLDKVRTKGYTVVKETKDEHNEIRLVLRKWD